MESDDEILQEEDLELILTKGDIVKEPIKYSSPLFNGDKWDTLGLCKPLIKSLKETQFNNPTEIQSLSIPLISEGKDLLCQSVTGSGKTAAFLLPILQKIYLSK